jgi:hypothetical protein
MVDGVNSPIGLSAQHHVVAVPSLDPGLVPTRLQKTGGQIAKDLLKIRRIAILNSVLQDCHLGLKTSSGAVLEFQKATLV